MDNIKSLWLLGTTFKSAAATATKELAFKVSPARISRLRSFVTMRLATPFDGWKGRCRKSGWSWEKWLTEKEWDKIGSWILRHKLEVSQIRDVLILGKMARMAGVKNVNPHTMLVALSMWKAQTGYDPNSCSEADGVAGDQGSVGDAPVAESVPDHRRVPQSVTA